MPQNRKIPEFLQGVEDESLICAGDTIVTAYLKRKRNDAGARSLKKLFVSFLEQVSGFDKVYFIMGNHEHYRGHLQSSPVILREFFDYYGFDPKKFIVLDNDVVSLNDKTLMVGATLWTDMRRDNPQSHWFVGRGMNDFRLIEYGPQDDVGMASIFRTEDAVTEHKKSLAFITKTVEDNKDKRIIVVTHHAPSYQSNGRAYNGSEIIDGYCSDLEQFIIDHPNITDWVHGHTHVNVEYEIGQCRITSNMRGYVGYDFGTNFTSDQFLDKFIEV
jgi:hypothetical protein